MIDYNIAEELEAELTEGMKFKNVWVLDSIAELYSELRLGNDHDSAVGLITDVYQSLKKEFS